MISEKILFTLLAKSIGFGLVIMKLVSPAYNTSLVLFAVTVGKSFIYSKKSKGPRIEPCGTPCLQVSSLNS